MQFTKTTNTETNTLRVLLSVITEGGLGSRWQTQDEGILRSWPRLSRTNRRLHIAMELNVFLKAFTCTRPKPAYGRQGLDWIIGPGYSFVVFSTTDLLWSKKRHVTHGGVQLTSFGPKNVTSLTRGPNRPPLVQKMSRH